MENNQRNEREIVNKPGLKNFDLMFLIWSIARPILIVVVCIMIVTAAVYASVDFALNRFWLPVDETDDSPIQVVVARGSSVGAITKTLEAYNLVRNSTVFEYYIDFSGYGSKMKAGTYVFNKQMSMQEIMDKLSKGDGRSVVTTFTIIEGLTIEDMAESLVKQNIISDKEDFLSLAKDGKEFLSYSFIAALGEEELVGRNYALEGYLFPDKYEIYVGSSEESIMKKMLNKFNSVMSEKYLSRATEMGLTIDEIITLASVIEREAKPDDFSKVSAVFMNRIQQGMALESCATVQYVLGIRKLNLTAEDIAVDSPYNTYKYKGIPVGPICAPSQKSIEAALYPNEEYLADGYLYFATKDPESGELVFNITYSEHLEDVEKYRPLWEAYDKQAGY